MEGTGKDDPLRQVEGFAKLSAKIGQLESVRSICQSMEIPIPGVVVVGEQSAGKSSVLENISGIKFPRAQNTCTRMPCVVQLITDHREGEDGYALVSMNPDFADAQRCKVDEVQTKITDLTEKLARGNSYISKTPINIRVVRNAGPQLSLIDLPGVTHNADKMSNIHDVTISLVEDYMKQDEMVILCVVPAMSDFGNAEVIKLARKHDPDGVRTLGVITKCDDAANVEASDILEKAMMSRPTDVRLSLGFHCVINHSQIALDKGQSREELRAKENELFEEHKRFKGLPSDRWGTARLTENIAAIQSERIDTCLPNIQEEVREKLGAMKKQLIDFPPQLESEPEQHRFFNAVLRKLQADFERRVRAEYISSQVCDKRLAVAPRVAEHVKTFRDELLKSNPEWLKKEMIDDVRSKVQDYAHGYTVCNLIGPAVFNGFIHRTFVEECMLVDAVSKLTTDIAELLKHVLCHLANTYATARHPVLANQIIELGEEAIQKKMCISQQYCAAVAEAQVVTSTTNGEYEVRLSTFRQGIALAMGQTAKQQRPQDLPQDFWDLVRAAKDSPEELTVLEICASLKTYTEYMLNGFVEMSSKLVQHNMVFQFMEELEMCCRERFEGSISALFPVDAKAVRRKAELEDKIKQLSQVKDMLSNLYVGTPPLKRARSYQDRVARQGT